MDMVVSCFQLPRRPVPWGVVRSDRTGLGPHFLV